MEKGGSRALPSLRVRECLKLAEATRGKGATPTREWALSLFHLEQKKEKRMMKDLSENEQQQVLILMALLSGKGPLYLSKQMTEQFDFSVKKTLAGEEEEKGGLLLLQCRENEERKQHIEQKNKN